MFKRLGMFDRSLGMFQPAGSIPFNPLQLFAAGEQGAWYDPSDFSTMFQDAAGTTPVTALEQPVGKILDKSGRGNHASQSTTTARPVLSARYNLLTYSEQFDNSAWTKLGLNAFGSGSVANTTATTDPLGTNTADFIQESTAGGGHYVGYTTLSVTSGGSYTASVYVKAAGRSIIRLTFSTGFPVTSAWFLLSTGTIGTQQTPGASITNVGGDWYRITATQTATSSTASAIVYITMETTNGGLGYTGNGTSGIYIWGADLRVANDGVNLPPYQRVGAATDYDSTGFPPYLAFDGVDDCLFTSAINFTATNKMTVVAGVRKLSDTVANAPAAIAELTASTASNNGSFLLSAPNSSGSASYSVLSKGTAISTNTVTTYTAPTTNVISAALDISNDGNSVKVNAGTATTSATDQGTGSFSNAALYIGRRGNSASFTSLSGRLYSLIVRGVMSTATQITQAENWVNSKTKAF